MPGITHPFMASGNAVAPGRPVRRAVSRRWDNVLLRPFRPLVTGSDPDHPAGPAAPVAAPVPVMGVQPAQPFALRTLPRTRLGPVLKGAPGKQGTGLGQPVGAGFQQLQYTGFTPMENAPATQGKFTLGIPRVPPGVPPMQQHELAPTYYAHDFAPAKRQFNQARSSGMWAQAHFPPQQRPLTPSVQGVLLRRPNNVVRQQIPAGQANPNLYTIGYPTRAGVAAQLGGGPVAVLGGNSQ